MARLPAGLKPLPKSKTPLRARSPYFLFCDSLRAAHANEPDKELTKQSMARASKVFSARWKLLTKEEKKPFEDRSSVLKLEHKNARNAATQAKKTNLSLSATLPTGWRAFRDMSSSAIVYVNRLSNRAQWSQPKACEAVTVPPRPLAAQRIFCDQARADGRANDVRSATILWRSLSTAERTEYDTAARQCKITYKTHLKSLRTDFGKSFDEASKKEPAGF